MTQINTDLAALQYAKYLFTSVGCAMTPSNSADRKPFLRNILLASTVTADSDRAMDRAVTMARSAGAHLYVVNVIDPGILPKQYVADAMARAEAQLQDDVQDHAATGGIGLSTEILLGLPDAAIVEKAEAVGADLIIMGLSRDATLVRVFKGTTIEKVVRQSTCPVLTVKARPRRPYESILVALDLKAASRRALDFALSAFPSSTFTILHVDEGAKRTQGSAGTEANNLVTDVVAARCAAAGYPTPGASGGAEIVILHDQAANVLAEEILRRRPDLVVLGTHGRTGMERLFLGSIAETLLETVPIDILIARA